MKIQDATLVMKAEDTMELPVSDGSGLAKKVNLQLISENSLRKLFVKAGAIYNELTGFYELNGLTDITYDQMVEIYKYGFIDKQILFSEQSGVDAFMKANSRTFLCSPQEKAYSAWTPRPIIKYNLMGTFDRCKNLEVVKLFNTVYEDGRYTNLFLIDGLIAFNSCSKLKEIQGVINLRYIQSNSFYSSMFAGCVSLQNVKIKEIKFDIKFLDSPLLSKESLLFLINYATNTNPIIVTLHKDAYEKHSVDPDIIKALEDAKTAGHEISLAAATA